MKKLPPLKDVPKLPPLPPLKSTSQNKKLSPVKVPSKINKETTKSVQSLPPLPPLTLSSKTNKLTNKPIQTLPSLPPLKTKKQQLNEKLIKACNEGNLETIKKLLDEGADNVNDCIYLASDMASKYLDIIKYLLNKIDNLDEFLIHVMNYPELRDMVLSKSKTDVTAAINLLYYEKLMNELNN